MDYITTETFKPERWLYAINKGIRKGIDGTMLRGLCTMEDRAALLQMIESGTYLIAPPHTAQIPKDTPGEYRTVYVNEGLDRVFLSIVNDVLFDTMPEMLHPTCKSYQRGLGCANVVQEASGRIVQEAERVGSLSQTVGWKADFTKYFDRVPMKYIDAAFDRVEQKYGESKVIAVVRAYYHSDYYLEMNPDATQPEDKWVVRKKWQSLKQGCAVASWLADVIMYDLDCALHAMEGYYVRYCDDTLFIGPDYKKAMAYLRQTMLTMSDEQNDMELQDRKVEYLTGDRYFKFLGFSIRGASITLSYSRLHTFVDEIRSCTIYADKKEQPIGYYAKKVMSYLFVGDGEHSWATSVLRVLNVAEDVAMLNTFAMDAIRAAATGRTKIGGLGYVKQGRCGVIDRGRGQHVTSNRQRTPAKIPGYRTIGCMKMAMHTSRAAFDTLCRMVA